MSVDMVDDRNPEALTRKIVLAAADVLEKDGLDAMSVRAVAARADVFPPTIFRVFKDKDGLLEALADYGFERYLRSKSRLPHSDDPVADLRAAWDLHVEFGLMQPAYYALVFGPSRSGGLSRAGRKAVAELQRMITRVAVTGRLRMTVERATAVMHSAGVGVVSTLISTPPEQRDPGMAQVSRDMVLDAITASAAEPEITGTPGKAAGPAMALRATLADDAELPLTPGEKLLLLELLNRLADTGTATG
ncbi:TetR family transcriptional regulator [Streptomyces sp. NPDC093970]|uniref:TetR/AcrR family transcriptional regulator n=1 Tax=Streptomyces sp. NPDC093970 TaxID=3155076 RepID=UPI00341BDDE6